MYTSTTQPRNIGSEPHSEFSASTFGLRVRVAVHTTQRYLFGGRGAFPDETRSLALGHDGPSVLTRLAEELCISVARIVVRDFRIHSQLERTIPAILRNVRLSFWSCARRAALDAASALASGAKRRVVQSDLAISAANIALRIAELCEKAEQQVRYERHVTESYEQARRSDVAAMHRDRREREARRRAEAEESV
ncbi:MAG: hypothetical protein ABI672_14025 [Vicinamibacteria bacterium]